MGAAANSLRVIIVSSHCRPSGIINDDVATRSSVCVCVKLQALLPIGDECKNVRKVEAKLLSRFWLVVHCVADVVGRKKRNRQLPWILELEKQICFKTADSSTPTIPGLLIPLYLVVSPTLFFVPVWERKSKGKVPHVQWKEKRRRIGFCVVRSWSSHARHEAEQQGRNT